MNKIRINFESAASEIRTDVCGRAMFYGTQSNMALPACLIVSLKKKRGPYWSVVLGYFRLPILSRLDLHDNWDKTVFIKVNLESKSWVKVHVFWATDIYANRVADQINFCAKQISQIWRFNGGNLMEIDKILTEIFKIKVRERLLLHPVYL